MIKKNLLILERSSGNLELNKETTGQYVLQGIFGEIDVKNKNNRIYTESEYVPQIKALQDKIKSSKLLGELDHPANFEISLKNVSHIIEELTYDEKTKQVRGRIRLLDTEAGKQAKALVDAGVPLQISSRAAGAVESNGKVKIKQLFTYDLVADPGFANAELSRVNESFGISDDSDIQIYEMLGTTELIKDNIENNKTEIMLINEENSKVVSVEDFNKYSHYLAEEIKSLKESINSLTENKESGVKSEELQKIKEYTNYLAETLDNSISYAEHAAEGVNGIKEYTNYLAESFNESVETVTGLNERMDQITAYTEYVAETVNTNLIVEDTEEVEDIEESLDLEIVTEEEALAEEAKIKEGNAFGDAVRKAKEAGEKEFEFEGKTYKVEEAEETEETDDDEDEPEVIDDAEVEIATEGVEETKDKDGNGKEAEDIEAENDAKDVTEPTEFDGKKVDQSAKDKSKELEGDATKEIDGAGKEVAEGVEETKDKDGNGKEVKEIEDEDDSTDVTEPTEFDGKAVDETPTDKSKELEDDATKEIDGAGKEVVEEIELEIVSESELAVSNYQDDVHSRLKDIIEASNRKPSTDPGFFNFVSESVKNDFKALNEDDKATVLSVVEKQGFLSEGQIVSLWNDALTQVQESDLPVVALMPDEYKETWDKLSEGKRSSLIAQSKFHNTNSKYEVKTFWQTRDMRETSIPMEVSSMNESNIHMSAKAASSLPYDLEDMKTAIAKQFKK